MNAERAAHRSLTNRFYTRSVLHNLFNTQQFFHWLIAPQAWSYTKLLCMTPATDPTRGVSAHALIQHATIPHSPRFTTDRFHTSPIQHNSFLHICFSTQPVSTHQFFSTKLVLHHRSPFLRVTAFEPTALLAERVQNISIQTVYIDIFCTRSAKSAVGSKAVTRFCTRIYLRWVRQEGAMAYLHDFLSLIFFLFEISTIVWHGF